METRQGEKIGTSDKERKQGNQTWKGDRKEMRREG